MIRTGLDRLARRCGRAFSILAAALLAAPSSAQVPLQPAGPATNPAPVVSPPAGASAHALTAEDLGGWLDGLMPYALQRGDVPGAVVVVVKDGRPLLERGYGFADVAARRPIDPATTLFRPGSISKTFTWTAVMQLVEAGKLDLDRDVNDYLDFRNPAAFGRPVTLRNLLTHSGGFADVSKGLIVFDPHDAHSLRQALVGDMPARIYPPGTTPAYSNWGAGLAGYIVQRVSGEAYPEYIERHIFAPLGMAHASFRQPLPAALVPDMARGYRLGSDAPKPFEYIPAAPAGALSASGDDIGRWMIAQLGNGAAPGGGRILQARTAEQMHSPQFRPVPGVEAMAFGFYTEPGNGHRVIAHMGDTELFHSDMHLFLDDGLGIYVSLNGGGKGDASYAIRRALYRGFLDRYFPAASAPAAPTSADAAVDGRTLAGLYVSTLRSSDTWRRLPEQLLGQVKVSADKDGVLTVASMHGLAGQPIRWRETGPFQYQEIGGPHRLGAVVKDGHPVLIQADDFPPVEALQPVSPGLSASWNVPVFAMTLMILAVAAVTWPIGAVARRRYGVVRAARPGASHAAARMGCVVQLVFWIGWFVFLTRAGGVTDFLGPTSDGWVRVLQLVGWIGVLGALAAVWHAGGALRDPTRRVWGRLAPVLIALACAATVWFGFSLSLLDGRLTY